jgi:hypothetical protein
MSFDYLLCWRLGASLVPRVWQTPSSQRPAFRTLQTAQKGREETVRSRLRKIDDHARKRRYMIIQIVR